MNSYKKLMKNSIVFAVGSLGSKVISFILVPLYTYYLSTEQFGTIDLVTATAAMLLPIISASVFQAILRFVMDKEKSEDVILTNTLIIATIGWLIAFMTYPLLSFFNIFEDKLIYLYLILIIQIFEQIFSLYARALGKIKIFALNGLILTFTTGVFNILFLVYFELGVSGYFWAIITSNIISIIYLNVTTKSYKDISLSKYDLKIVKELLEFSIPIIPNSLMWSLMNTFSKYIILLFVGVGGNGLFAVASKITILINMINQVFTQAWQISAIEEYESENKSKFYSNVFTYLSSILFIGVSALLIVIKVAFDFFFSVEYYEAWLVVPFLLLGTVFASFSSFLGTNYIAAKQTKGVFKTSVYGGVISVVLNIILIYKFGVIGAGISSMVSFFAVFIMRVYDTKQFINMQINWSLFIKSLMIISCQIAVLMIFIPRKLEVIIEFSLFLMLILANKQLIKPFFKKNLRRF